MGMKKFQIEIEGNPYLSYFPGQTIIGQVKIETNKDTKNDGIYVEFEGEAKVHWTEQRTITETHGSGSNRRTTTRTITEHYSAKEKYFEYKLYLLGTGNSKQVLQPGQYSFPFQFTLPSPLPSSFVGPHGIVWYEIKAVMKKSWSSNAKARVPFTVNGILDLNHEVGVNVPVEIRKFKNLCCLCCKSGPVGFVLNMKKKGYVSGEFVEFTAELNNQSNKKVRGVNLSLVQAVTFHATRKSRTTEKVICSVKGPGCERGETEIWRGEIMRIPSLPPSRLAGCRIIDVQYLLKVEMELAGPSINLRDAIPITIGSIPLRDDFNRIFTLQSTQPSTDSVWRVPEIPVPSPFAPPSYSPPMVDFNDQTAFLRNMYPEMPPPTYEQAISQDRFINTGGDGDGNGEDEGGNQNPGFTKEKERKGSDAGGESSSAPSAPPPEDFSPKYITYAWN